jgi:uncharacterized protein YkwD
MRLRLHSLRPDRALAPLRASLLRAGLLTAVTLSAALLPATAHAGDLGGSNDAAVQAPAAAPVDAVQLEQMVLELINDARTSRGLAPLELDPLMTEVARVHAQDMMESGKVSHVGSDGSLPLDRLRRGGVRFNWGGENIWTYWGRQPEKGPETMHGAMMDEPHEPGLWNHIANILMPHYKRVGIGIVVNARGVQYLSEEFAD